MPKIMMVAKKRQKFGRGVLLEGEEFEATQSEARLLLALDLASRVPTPPAPPQEARNGTYRRRDMQAEKREPRRRRKQERIVH